MVVNVIFLDNSIQGRVLDTGIELLIISDATFIRSMFNAILASKNNLRRTFRKIFKLTFYWYYVEDVIPSLLS